MAEEVADGIRDIEVLESHYVFVLVAVVLSNYYLHLVKPPKRGHFWNQLFVHRREDVLYQRYN